MLIDKIYGTPRKTEVLVEVTSLDGNLKAIKKITIKPDFTKVDFYLDNKIMPFRFKSVAKKGNLISDYLDADIVAIPYFFNDINFSSIS